MNINNRLRQHNAGLVETTKYRLPLDLLYTEEFETAKEAFKLERALKGLWAARFKKKLKEKYLIQQKERKVI